MSLWLSNACYYNSQHRLAYTILTNNLQITITIQQRLFFFLVQITSLLVQQRASVEHSHPGTFLIITLKEKRIPQSCSSNWVFNPPEWHLSLLPTTHWPVLITLCPTTANGPRTAYNVSEFGEYKSICQKPSWLPTATSKKDFWFWK